jgi:hypothetical protein
MSDAAPPLPRAAVLALAVLTVVLVGVLSLALFWGDIVEDGSTSPVAVETVGDDFDRPDGPLGGDWSQARGTWVVQDDHAALGELSPDDASGLAVLGVEDPSSIEVTARAVEPGWGVAFRVAGPDDLLAVVARDQSWSVVRLAGATVTDLDAVDAVPRDNAVVRVDLVGEQVRVTIDEATTEVTAAGAADAGDVGLLALPGASLASMAWDDLTVTGS